MNIDINEVTFKRLADLAKGFDTPDVVINRLIDQVTNTNDSKPKITFNPSDEKHFLDLLVKIRIAEVVIHKDDGTRIITQWNVNKLTTNSNLRGNLWSGFLRGWKEKGIVSAELTINPILPADHEDHLMFERDRILSSVLGLTLSEIRELDDDYEITKCVDVDGCIYNYIIQLRDTCDPKILANINGLDENKQLTFGAYTNTNTVAAISPFCSRSILVQQGGVVG